MNDLVVVVVFLCAHALCCGCFGLGGGGLVKWKKGKGTKASKRNK
jgi:hypothetical protein